MSQKRKLEDPNEAFCQTPPKKSRTQYSLDFKLNVLDNAKSFSSNRTLASHFHIDEKQIRQWKKDESKLRSSKEHENGSRKRVEGAGRKPNDPELDEELSSWILLKRSENLRVTRKQIISD